MNRVHLLLTLSAVAGLLGVAAGCSRGLPTEIDQSTGNAPLVVDLDVSGSPIFVLGTGGVEVEHVTSVRGPNKGDGERGGITGSFMGTGGNVCVIMDPSAKWDPNDPQTALDGGDIDLYVGKSADYSGEPGFAIGDFHATYTDPLGVNHILDENACIQISSVTNLPGAHSGIATPEFCTIQTEAGTAYTVLGETISVPPGGIVPGGTGPGVTRGILKVSTEVRSGACPAVAEGTLTGDTDP